MSLVIRIYLACKGTDNRYCAGLLKVDLLRKVFDCLYYCADDTLVLVVLCREGLLIN